MSTPDNSATMEERVNTVITESTRDEKGKLQFAEGTSEEMQFAARSEIRRRDTFTNFNESNKRVKSLEAQNSKLSAHALDNVQLDLSEDERERLEDLKAEDPDKYIEEVTLLNEEARNKTRTTLKEYETAGDEAGVLATRSEMLKQFQTDNPDVKIDDDVIKYDLPPRIARELEQGKVTFSEFLDNARAFLTGGKVVQGTEVGDKKNLDNIQGGDKPSDSAVKGDVYESYKTEIY